MLVESVDAVSLLPLVGRPVGQIAVDRGVTPFEAFLDVALEDDLGTCYSVSDGTDDAAWSLRASLWKDPRTLIGASDAGAHLDMLASFGYCTDLLGPSVRDRQLLPLEEAVRLVTDAPARFYGLRDRGRLEVGWHADIVIFDPATLGSTPVVMRNDMPGGYSRTYSEAIGISHVLVNGVPIVEHGKPTGSRPGTVLRGGRDTN
jgi:N-acyl-D-aspartate/D-glutamate deacylase